MRASSIRHSAILFRLLIAILSVAALSTAALAQERGQGAGLPDQKMDRGTAQLVVEGPVAPGAKAEIAILFRPDEGWHGYWKNPGDAGQGLSLDWTLPAGWSVGEARFPVPQTFFIAGLMNHIYKGEHAVLVPIAVPADTAPGAYRVSAYGEWLTCSDTLCVPQWGTLAGDVRVREAADAAPVDPRFDTWRAAIPPPLDSAARFDLGAAALRIAIPIPAAMDIADPHVFLETEQVGDYAAVQTFYREGDLLMAEIPRKGEGAPQEVRGILSLGAGNGIAFVAEPGEVPMGGTLVKGPEPLTPPLWLLIGGALVGGLLLNIMPCVFPILSLKAISLARAGESETQARREGLAYTAGVVLACLALGAVMLALRAAGEQVGWAFQLQEPGVVVALLILAVVITANFAGLFELPSLSVTRNGEPASAFATGLLAAFVATPCTGPFMAVALGAALLLPPVQSLLLFAMLGLGLALPFLLVGFVPALRRRLPAPGPWMDRFRRIMAIPMGLTALALVWLVARIGGREFALIALLVTAGVVIALGVVGRLQQRGKMAWPAFGLVAAPFLLFGAFALPASFAAQQSAAGESLLAPRPFSEAVLAEARTSGRPVFVWFTADWCVTCKVNESVAIEREATRAAFEEAGVVAIVGDWTRRDTEISAFLTRQGAAGVPLYLWYEPGGEAEQLPQVLTADMLIERAAQPR